MLHFNYSKAKYFSRLLLTTVMLCSNNFLNFYAVPDPNISNLFNAPELLELTKTPPEMIHKLYQKVAIKQKIDSQKQLWCISTMKQFLPFLKHARELITCASYLRLFTIDDVCLFQNFKLPKGSLSMDKKLLELLETTKYEIRLLDHLRDQSKFYVLPKNKVYTHYQTTRSTIQNAYLRYSNLYKTASDTAIVTQYYKYFIQYSNAYHQVTAAFLRNYVRALSVILRSTTLLTPVSINPVLSFQERPSTSVINLHHAYSCHTQCVHAQMSKALDLTPTLSTAVKNYLYLTQIRDVVNEKRENDKSQQSQVSGGVSNLPKNAWRLLSLSYEELLELLIGQVPEKTDPEFKAASLRFAKFIAGLYVAITCVDDRESSLVKQDLVYLQKLEIGNNLTPSTISEFAIRTTSAVMTALVSIIKTEDFKNCKIGSVLVHPSTLSAIECFRASKTNPAVCDAEKYIESATQYSLLKIIQKVIKNPDLNLKSNPVTPSMYQRFLFEDVEAEKTRIWTDTLAKFVLVILQLNVQNIVNTKVPVAETLQIAPMSNDQASIRVQCAKAFSKLIPRLLKVLDETANISSKEKANLLSELKQLIRQYPHFSQQIKDMFKQSVKGQHINYEWIETVDCLVLQITAQYLVSNVSLQTQVDANISTDRYQHTRNITRALQRNLIAQDIGEL